MSLTLIKNAHVFAPNDCGVLNVLVGGGRILGLGTNLDISLSGCDSQMVTIVEANGQRLIPGLVDPLVHISGGGGEGGFHTRTPEMKLTEATLGGVTTVVAALGTDASSRSLTELLAKAYALRNEGISAYCYTGSYEVPVRTFSGSVRDDIMFIEAIIGVGEIAISDHRSSQPSVAELARIAADARVGGMLSGKSGIVLVHVGDGAKLLSPLHDVVANSEILPSQFYPTHINRTQALLDAGVEFAKAGGFIDLTTSTTEQLLAGGEIAAAKALSYALQQGVPVTQITMSSDGNASLPDFDKAGRLIGLQAGRVASLLESAAEAVANGLSIESVVRSVSTNAADILKLPHKGRIVTGADADLVLLDDNFKAQQVWGKGRLLVADYNACVSGHFG
ncbi:MAG: beta-aspartyl-peptidase [Idiomarina sp.]